MGLLDFAQQPPGLLAAAPTSGMGGLLADPSTALFASLLGRGNFGTNLQRGIAGAQAQAQQQQENQIKGLLYGSQIAENNSQAALRGAQVKKLQGDQDIIRGILPGWGAVPAAGGTPTGVPGGMPGATPAPGQAPDLSRVDVRAVSRDLIKDLKGEQVLALENAGLKGVTDIWKELRPKMQVAGGYAYDQNSVPTGFLPQVNIANNGMASLVLPGQNGEAPTIQAPQGAIPTFQAYQRAEQGVKDESTFIPSYGPTGQPGTRTVANFKQGQGQVPQVPPTIGSALTNLPEANPAVTGSFQGAAGDILRQIADIRDPQERSNALQAYTNQQQQSQGFNPTGPSAAQAAEQEALKTGATGQATADVLGTQSKAAAIDKANNAIGLIDKAIAHPGLEVATGASGVFDPRNYIPGTEAKDFNALKEQLGGTAFLTAYSDLRGTGAISGSEGDQARNAIARMQSAQSSKAFKEALTDYRGVVQQGITRLKTSQPATESQAPKQQETPSFNNRAEFPAANAKNRGKILRGIGADEGKVFESDGFQWKERK